MKYLFRLSTEPVPFVLALVFVFLVGVRLPPFLEIQRPL